MLKYIRKRIRSLAGAAQRLKNDTELFKQFMDSQSFKRWLTETVFGIVAEQT